MRLTAKLRQQQRVRTPCVRTLLLHLCLITVFASLLLSVPYARAEETNESARPGDNAESGLISLGDGEGGISADELSSNRAKAMLEIDKVFINDQELNGSVSGNSAVNTHSGDNTIDGSAFSNASGLVNTIQNTGNNVLIQSATIVNVSIED